MPELPEVETTRRGIVPHLVGKQISKVIVRQAKLRWPIPADLPQKLARRKLLNIQRRAKYLLFQFKHGTLVIHLGMSGSLRILPANTHAEKHDHVDFIFANQLLRYHDPRRFGAILWTELPIEKHKLLSHLGPEPLADTFDQKYLFNASRTRKTPVKNFIMDGKIVVGVGNIYANEALFMAGINPNRHCNKISAARYAHLNQCIKKVLTSAIEQGGTTLQDFLQADGKPGYFSQQLQVYGRGGQPCPVCGAAIKEKHIGQRNSFYCSNCQT